MEADGEMGVKMSEGQKEEIFVSEKRLRDAIRENARLSIVIDIQKRQIKSLVSEKADLLSEINALYRTGGHE